MVSSTVPYAFIHSICIDLRPAPGPLLGIGLTAMHQALLCSLRTEALELGERVITHPLPTKVCYPGPTQGLCRCCRFVASLKALQDFPELVTSQLCKSPGPFPCLIGQQEGAHSF